LKSLGELCGLVSKTGPTSEDLNRTVDLLAGLGDERPETVSSLQSPYKKLKEALSSVEAFERHYLVSPTLSKLFVSYFSRKSCSCCSVNIFSDVMSLEHWIYFLLSFTLFLQHHLVGSLLHQELSHAAMEMYRAIGRLRSGRLVGKSLAEFYM
ncbi:hypothetical protein GOODEAATRI_014821, partial [Goodea atripinnis]